MHDGVDTVRPEHLQNLFTVAHAADNQGRVEDRLTEAAGQVVQDHDVLATGAQLEDRMTADVTRAAGD